MKIRTDYITNSSSSSFTLTINIPTDVFILSILEDYIISPFIDSYIDSTQYDLNTNLQNKKEGTHKFLREYYTNRIKSLREQLTKLKAIQKNWKKNPTRSKIALAKLILADHNLEIISGNTTTIKGGISMYNGIGDIPEIIMAFITYASLNGIAHAWTNISDNEGNEL